MDISENSEVLPGYRLKQFLGRGSYGEAWEAVAPGEMPVAIKFIRLEQTLSDSDQRELAILRTVRHAHLLDVHFVQEVDGYLLMGMPLCDQDLLGRLKKCQVQGKPGIPPEELLDLMEESAKALDFLHGHNVIHRDIKPANIFLVGGTAKVADFGLARVLNHSLSAQSGLKGTPAYVAPEIVQGQGAKASDQYSLAVSYCQLRTGRFPIQAEGVMAFMMAHVQQAPDLQGYEAQEAKALERALAKTPNARWPTCRAFVKALRTAWEATPTNQPTPVEPPVPALESPATMTVPPDFAQPQPSKRRKRKYRPGDERNDNGLEMPFVAIPAGSFLMGDPVNQVEVKLTKSFWLAKYTVRQEEWFQIMGTQPWDGENFVKSDPRCPATYVSWEDAMAFCQKLTEQEQHAKRISRSWRYTLPTEAQWEYACRAGTTMLYSFGDDESALEDYGWFAGNAEDAGNNFSHPVGQKQPNPWNLYDMHGNVWEWCQDWYHDKLSGGRNPVMLEEASLRVNRGGSWDVSAEFCRSAFRLRDWPENRNNYLGFRVAAVPG